MAPLVGVPEEIAKGQYINGLKDEIKAELRLLGPRNLDHAMDLSIKIEEKLHWGMDAHSRNKGTSFFTGTKATYGPFSQASASQVHSEHKSTGGSYSSTRSPTIVSNQSGSAMSSINLNQIPVAKPVGKIQRWSDKEWKSRREKGLCFKCDGKWQVGHRYN